jgi:hypothetical protein
MSWTKRLLLALPFAIAAVLTVLLLGVDRQHGQHVAGYCFLFGTPWAWLLDRGWFGHVRSRWGTALELYSLVLWIPAALYSSCIWLIFAGLEMLSRRHSNLSVPDQRINR